VRVHEVIALAADQDAAAVRFAGHCRDGLDRYLGREFAAAAAAFEAALALRPDDVAARRFVDRSRTCAAAPPPPDWTGVFHATEK